MSSLKESLLKRVCGLSSVVLSELLFKVLPYINVQPLQQVVMQILKQHPDPPPAGMYYVVLCCSCVCVVLFLCLCCVVLLLCLCCFMFGSSVEAVVFDG